MCPIFDYKCPNCDIKITDRFVHKYNERIFCKQCGSIMSKLVPTTVGAKTFPADGIYLEHVEPGGKTFYSEKEMRIYEKETGTTIGMLH